MQKIADFGPLMTDEQAMSFNVLRSMVMPYIIKTTSHPYTTYEIYECGIEVETGHIEVESMSGKGTPIYIMKPRDRGSGELIKALERLEIELSSLEPRPRGPRSLKVGAYTTYKIQGQEIGQPIETEEHLKLPPHKEFPIIVGIPWCPVNI
jgi:hypothetical protein